MNNKNKILLGTFLVGSGVSKIVIRNIIEVFDVKKLFIFSFEENNKHKFLVTFNIDKEKSDGINKFKESYKNTTRLHRNKETNTLYTINSLNELVKNESKQEQVNKSFKIKWENYQNCLIYLNNKQLSFAKLKLTQIINI